MSEFKISDMRTIKKGWGRESDGVAEVFAYHTDQETSETTLFVETVKLLHMGQGKRLSRHYHKDKDEYFICVAGAFKIELWDMSDQTTTGESVNQFTLKEGERFFIPCMLQHRMTGLEKINTLLEVSTRDKDSDSYRIERGD
jgi:mannose-6-phosphate isomerase-like protein (cupin superfamily)